MMCYVNMIVTMSSKEQKLYYNVTLLSQLLQHECIITINPFNKNRQYNHKNNMNNIIICLLRNKNNIHLPEADRVIQFWSA